MEKIYNIIDEKNMLKYSTEDVGENYHYYIESNKDQLYLYKAPTMKFEKIIEIQAEHKETGAIKIYNQEEVNKFLFYGDFIDEFKNYKNFRINTEISDTYFIKKIDDISFLNLYGVHSTPYKLEMNLEEEKIQIKMYFNSAENRNHKLKKYIELDMLSFNLKDNKAFYFPRNKMGEKLNFKQIEANKQYCFIEKLPENIQLEIFNELKLRKENIIGKKIDFEFKTTQDIFAINKYPEFPELYSIENFFGKEIDLGKSKEEILIDISKAVNLDCDERFKNIFKKDPISIIVAGILKKAGCKEIDLIYNFVEKKPIFKNFILSASYNALFKDDSTYYTMNKFRNMVTETLKHRSEKDLLYGLGKMGTDFHTGVFDYVATFAKSNLYNSYIWDRLVYNKFNAHAFGLCMQMQREEYNKLFKKLVKEAYKTEIEGSNTYYLSNDKTNINNLLALCGNRLNYEYTDMILFKANDDIPCVCGVANGNYPNVETIYKVSGIDYKTVDKIAKDIQDERGYEKDDDEWLF